MNENEGEEQISGEFTLGEGEERMIGVVWEDI